MDEDDAIAESLFEDFNELAGKGDFGNEEDDGLVVCERS